MICKDDFQYVVILINDYLNTLPPSSKIAVAAHAQIAVGNIEKALSSITEDTDKAE